MPRPAHFDLDKTNSDEETAYIELPLEALTLLVSTSENALLAYPQHLSDQPLSRYPLDKGSAGRLLDPQRTRLGEEGITLHHQGSSLPLKPHLDPSNYDLIRLEHGGTRHTIDLQEPWERDRHQNPDN